MFPSCFLFLVLLVLFVLVTWFLKFISRSCRSLIGFCGSLVGSLIRSLAVYLVLNVSCFGFLVLVGLVLLVLSLYFMVSYIHIFFKLFSCGSVDVFGSGSSPKTFYCSPIGSCCSLICCYSPGDSCSC